MKPVFHLFYIMTEGMELECRPAVERTQIILVIVDALQVLRAVCSAKYGWTSQALSIVEIADITYFITSRATGEVASFEIPRYSYFALGCALVLTAIFHSFYVVRLFRIGNVKTLWQVKMLRLLVATLVTTFFATVLPWVLVPFECLISDTSSFSSNFHHVEEGDWRCTPMAFPEAFFSIPAAVIAAAYIAFAIRTTQLDFEINPLSRNPRAMYTGRVEMHFTANKVLITLLVYLTEMITPVAVAMVALLHAVFVAIQHLTVLPFNSSFTNNVRGGVFGSVVWINIANVIVAGLRESDAADQKTEDGDEDGRRLLQIVLVAIVPLAFMLGYFVASLKQRKLELSLYRLRGEWEAVSQNNRTAQHAADGAQVQTRTGSVQETTTTTVATSRSRPSRRVWDKYFDREWEMRRKFPHARKAIVLLRSLLLTRNRDDLPFMKYILQRAVDEHPESHQLAVLRLAFERFVFQDADACARVQRVLLKQPKLAIEHEYILYVMERRGSQEATSAHLGQEEGAVSTINQMEFEISIDRARKAHMACVKKMKSFWKLARRRRKATQGTQVSSLVNDVNAIEAERVVAMTEYQSLIDKYPQSIQLLRAYAAFCDTILNDVKQAEALRDQADLLDGEAHPQALRGGGGEVRMDWEQSTVSEREPYRAQIQGYLTSHRDDVLGAQMSSVRAIHARVVGAVVVLSALSALGFALTDQLLFNDYALKNIERVDKTGLFRAYTISSNFLLRSRCLHAQANDTESAAAVTTTLQGLMEQMRVQHRSNYESASSGKMLAVYREEPIEVDIPTGANWQRTSMAYWELANDFTRRVESAVLASPEELRAGYFGVANASISLADHAYIFENSQKSVIPTLESVVSLYEDEVQEFGFLSSMLSAVNATVNALLVVIISVFVLRTLVTVLHLLNFQVIFCTLAMSVPHDVAQAFYAYYAKVELEMRMMEDEDLERQALQDPEHEEQKEEHRAGGGMSEDDAAGVVPRAASGLDLLPKPHRVSKGVAWVDLTSKGDEGVSTAEAAGGAGGMQCLTADNVATHTRRVQSDEAEDGEEEEEEGSEGAEQGQARKRAAKLATTMSFKTWLEGSREATALTGLQADGALDDEGIEEGGGEEDGGSRVEDRIGAGEGASATCDDTVTPMTSHLGTPVLAVSTPQLMVVHQRIALPLHQEGMGGAGVEVAQSGSDGSAKVTAESYDIIAADEIEEDQTVNDDGGEEREAAFVMRLSETDRGVGENVRSGPEERDAASFELAASGINGTATTCFVSGAFAGQGPNTDQTASGTDETQEQARSPLARSPFRKKKDQDEKEQGSDAWSEPTEEERAALGQAAQGRWRGRTRLTAGVLCVMLALCVFGVMWPSRRVSSVVNVAALTNQAGRRRYLLRSCAHFARELVLDDGLARMPRSDLAMALRFHLAELQRADAAVRMGGDLHVQVGADDFSAAHNNIMYGSGCPWREDPTDCSTPLSPGSAEHGLHLLMLAFYNAVDRVLSREAPAPAGTDDAPDGTPHFRKLGEVPRADEYEWVRADAGAGARLSEPSVAFILSSFSGDAFEGLGAIVRLFHAETASVLDAVRLELRLLFALQMVVLLGGFYLGVFRRTVHFAQGEVDRIRLFVTMLPCHQLQDPTVRSLLAFFLSLGSDGPVPGAGADEDDNDNGGRTLSLRFRSNV